MPLYEITIVLAPGIKSEWSGEPLRTREWIRIVEASDAETARRRVVDETKCALKWWRGSAMIYSPREITQS